MTLIIAEIMKALGAIAITVAAIYAVYSDKDEKIQDGRLTRKGKWLILVAAVGLITSVGTQIAQYLNAVNSAEMTRQRNERTSTQLSNMANRLEREALAATPLKRFTVITYFDKEITAKDLVGKENFLLHVVFIRGNQSEFRIAIFVNGKNQIDGLIQLEGAEQRVTVPLSEGALYATGASHFQYLGLDTTSIWTDIRVEQVAEALAKSHDGEFKYWPYHTLGDFQDVSITITKSGAASKRINKMFLRFNEDIIFVVPHSQGHEVNAPDLPAFFYSDATPLLDHLRIVTDYSKPLE